MKKLKLLSLIAAAAGLVAIAAPASAGTLTITSGPTFNPTSAFTNNSIQATRLQNPPGVAGDVIRVSGSSTITPGTSSVSISLNGNFTAKAGEKFSGAYSFVVDSSVGRSGTYNLTGTLTVPGFPQQNANSSGTVNPGLNQYKGTFASSQAFPIGASGTFTGTLTFNFPSSSAAQASASSVDPAAAADGSMNVSIEQMDFQLAPTNAVVVAPAQPLNISTRLAVLNGDNVLIAGFIVQGDQPKKVLVRGLGPSLSSVGGALLQDPTLELHVGEATVTNDDWKEHQTEVEATTIPPTNDKESAIVATLDPGSYTVILAGKDGGTGVGVVEVYDLSQSATTRLANISTRGFVQTGDNVMIGGFILGPDTAASSSVIVRALGPSLDAPNVLDDPFVELRDSNGDLISSNDNWPTSPDRQKFEDNNLAPNNPFEAAVFAIPAPGNYTAVVHSANNTTGVGLVEVYHLQ